MNRKRIKVVKTNNYKGLCIRHTFVKRELLLTTEYPATPQKAKRSFRAAGKSCFCNDEIFLGGMDIIFSPKEPIIFIKNMTAILKTGCIVIWRCTYDDYRNDTICATKL